MGLVRSDRSTWLTLQGGGLAAAADRDAYRYALRTTRDRVKRSCSAEMEREVHDILGPVGLDMDTSCRVAHRLTDIEKGLPEPAPQSTWRPLLSRFSRRPRTIDVEMRSKGEAGEVGMTTFLLKFREHQEVCLHASGHH